MCVCVCGGGYVGGWVRGWMVMGVGVCVCRQATKMVLLTTQFHILCKVETMCKYDYVSLICV